MLMNIIFCCHGNGCSRLNMYKVSLSYVSVQRSYGLEHVIIACGHLTNMQGCHGNCIVGLHVYTDYHG